MKCANFIQKRLLTSLPTRRGRCPYCHAQGVFLSVEILRVRRRKSRFQWLSVAPAQNADVTLSPAYHRCPPPWISTRTPPGEHKEDRATPPIAASSHTWSGLESQRRNGRRS